MMRKASVCVLVFMCSTLVLISISLLWPVSDIYLPIRISPTSQDNPVKTVLSEPKPYTQRISPVNFPCLGSRLGQAEDLFCLEKQRKLLPDYKNPCWRNNTGIIRCLPYFHLIGSDKCGSTDLFNRITHHPEVTNCDCNVGKESWYWSWLRYDYEHMMQGVRFKSFDSYVNKFDVSLTNIQKSSVRGYYPNVVGDGTPMDFWDFRGWKTIPQNSGRSEPIVLTPHLMKHIYGTMKFLLIFRNPVDRLYSDYYFLNYGNSTESFHRDAIASINMMTDCFKKMSVRACFYSDQMYLKLPTRIHIGCYSVFLKEWFSVFTRESFLFLRTEDYKNNIPGTLKDVFRFLNITDPDVETMNDIASLKRRHVTESKKKAKPMMEATRRILNDFYHKYNVELADILKDDRFLWQS